MKSNYTILLITLLAACTANDNNSNNKDSVIYNYEQVPAERSVIDTAAVKTYHEAGDIEKYEELTVSLYETKKTFHYLVKMQYKNVGYKDVNETDTLKIPNFGIQPAPGMIKGDKTPSCIIGFYDKDKKFRESKIIYFEKGQLKVHVLKHYAVATYQDKVK